ncbi:MAG: SDR family NAD(P)-dependent oxidoreductase [Bacteroidota bacterium]|jgi:3-oxoacyl-[acyl-carrier protein] reductase
MIDLSNQVAVVTGGSRGIGAATAGLLAHAGADVIIIYKSSVKKAVDVANSIASQGRECIALRGRLENMSECKKIVKTVIREFKRIDILVNSAGVWEFGEIGAMAQRDWNRSIAINLTSTFNMCNLVVPFMKRQKYGRIINISSTAGQRGEAFHSHYAAAKGGVIAFTKSLAAELISSGIWVNCVAPGWVLTDMTSNELGKSKSRLEILKTIPRGKIATPEEIAGPILFLSSKLADNIVGEVLNVNGGSVLCG